MKIAFLTGHIAGAPRKASITLLAEAYAQQGHEVRLVTNGYSWVTILRSDPRHDYARTRPMGTWFSVGPHLQGYVARQLINPGRFPCRFLNRISGFFFWRWGRELPRSVRDELHDAQLIIIESGAGLLYAQSIKHQFPAAKLVYSCSDRLSTLRVHPVLQRAQQQAEELFDAIMCPAQVMTQDFKHPHCYFVPQGVDKQALDRRTQSPYAQPRNIVSVGDMLFDEAAVLMLAKLAPDWTIHLFGAGAVCTQAPTNVITHGEKPFEDIVAYIQHADIGLAPYRMADGADYLSQSSLKMKQYTYARLPIIAPNFATAGCAHAQGYDPQQLESLAGAFDKARALDRSSISTETVLSWPQVAQRILDYVL